MVHIKFCFRLLLICFFVIAFKACGGSGALPQTSIPLPSNVDGLQISNQMSLVSAKSGASASISQTAIQSLKYAAPTSGDYVNDPVDLYVFDQAMDPIQNINEILCQINQTEYSSLVNQGNYIALNDSSLCEKDRSSDVNNQSTARQQSFEKWIVNVERLSDTSDQTVKIWISPFDQGGSSGGSSNSSPMSLFGQIDVSESSSDANPFGVFELNAGAYYDTDGTTGMTVVIKSELNDDGNVVLQMDNYEDDSGEKTQLYAVIDPTTDSGYGSTFQGFQFYTDENGNPVNTPVLRGKHSKVAFDSEYYLLQVEKDLNESVDKSFCLERNNFIRNVWEYNLYDSNGNRVDLNGGFPIIFSEDEWGFADYYGVYLPPDVGDISGASVHDDSGNNYTVFQGGGRLIKRTKKTIQLGELIGDIFQWWDDQDGLQYQVKWNGTSFVKIAEISFDETGETITPITAQTITLSPNEWFGLWKNGFGSLNIIVPNNGILTNSTTVPYYTEEYQTPQDVASLGSLYCYYDCPKGGVTVTDLNNNTPFYADEYSNGANPYIYSFDATNYKLRYSGQDVVISVGSSISDTSFYSWGLHSGPLLIAPVADPWLAWDQDVTYYWETGPDQWNRYTTLLDSNNQAVSFDAPLQCNYKDNDNGTYLLNYDGPGQLQGIPFDKVSDSDTDFDHWVARFAIPDGSELNCDGDVYYSKAMIVEQYMNEVDASNCSHLSIPSDIPSPSVTYERPDIGTAPDVTDQAKVVGGVVQQL